MQPTVGQQIGNYRILRLLGKGGTASVYLGEHIYLKSHAALKILHTALPDTEQFLTEARTLVGLAHPHIVRVLDFAVQDDVPFLVMDYASDGSVRQQYPVGTRLPLGTLVSYIQQIASALQYAHERCLIHRDVKPENMLLNAQHMLLLSDFGLSLFLQSANVYSTHQITDHIAGTSLYLAPEQLQGHPEFASDQYSLGVVVYEWLCGAYPFTGTQFEVALQHLSAPPPPLREHIPDLSPTLEAVVLLTLAKDPKERFPSVQAFAIALQQAALHNKSSFNAVSLELSSSSAEDDTLSIGTTHQFWNVPTFLTPLIGREQETAATCTLLQRSDIRLLTLFGPGGIGKTRLSLQIASEMRTAFTDGVCFVSLASLQDADQVMLMIARALEIPENDSTPLEQVKDALQEKQILLILDNFEQIVRAASSLERLLTFCPKLKLLVTSRVALRVQSEQLFTVSPLALPDLQHLPSNEETVAHYAAVALFVQRAQFHVPTFTVTKANAAALAEICVRLDGLPLAIELAAARVTLLPPKALLTRLSHRLQVLTKGSPTLPTRQQTLRSTIQWSYDLLNAREQQLFRCLAVFVGGCTVETVEALFAALDRNNHEGTLSVLDEVDSLLEKSLLRLPTQEEQEQEPRLHMLQTIREYALEALTANGELEHMSNAHANYYLHLAEEAEPKLVGAEQKLWLERLEQEYENILSALAWLFERAQAEGAVQAEQALRLCGTLYRFWWTRGYLREGVLFLERALNIRTGVTASVQAKVLYAYAMHIFLLEGVARAETACAESLALYRSVSETTGIATCLFLQGRLARNQCHYTSARNLLEEAVALFRKLNNTRQTSLCLSELALVLVPLCEYEQARMLLQESLVLAKAAGDTSLMAWAQYYLALIPFLSQTDLSQVQPQVEESMALYRATGDVWHVAYGLNLLGELYLVRGDVAMARTFFEESMIAFKEMGSRVDIAEFQIGLARVLTVQGELESAHSLYQQSLTALLEIGDKEPLPACLEGLAMIALRQDDLQQAARLWARAEALRQTFGTPVPLIYRVTYEKEISSVRTQLGDENFILVSAEGRIKPLEGVSATYPIEISSSQAASLEGRSSDKQPIASVPSKKKTLYPDELTSREADVLRLLAQGW